MLRRPAPLPVTLLTADGGGVVMCLHIEDVCVQLTQRSDQVAALQHRPAHQILATAIITASDKTGARQQQAVHADCKES